MNWKSLDDPENIENRNAGNGGDLVRHTVYLAVLRFLLGREPWSKGLVLRECHAGRGIYRIPATDPRLRLLLCLWTDPEAGSEVLLHRAQRLVLGGLRCWRNPLDGFHWYAGSALINAFTLADHQLGFTRTGTLRVAA